MGPIEIKVVIEDSERLVAVEEGALRKELKLIEADGWMLNTSNHLVVFAEDECGQREEVYRTKDWRTVYWTDVVFVEDEEE